MLHASPAAAAVRVADRVLGPVALGLAALASLPSAAQLSRGDAPTPDVPVRDARPDKGLPVERGYYEGHVHYATELVTDRISVQLDPALPVAEVRRRLMAVPGIDAEAMATAPVSELNWTWAPLEPGQSKDAVLALARSLDARAEFAWAMPGVVRSGELLGLTNQLMVSFGKGATPAEAAALFTELDLEVVEPLEYVEHGYLLRMPKGTGRTALELSSELFERTAAEWSVPDFVVHRELRDTPNDVYYVYQWHLHAGSTQQAQLGVKIDADVDAPEAWDIEKGDPSIRVAIIDDGVEYTHEDLAPNWVGGWDYLGNDSNPFPGSGDFHGTAVAGVAAARGDNGLGVSGVAQSCSILGIRLVGFGQTTSKEAQAFTYAKNNGADIINNSWGPPDGLGQFQPLPSNVKAAIDDCAINGRGGKGCVIFFAAGNGNESADLDGYASYANVISVAASTDQDERASYSDTGNSVDVCAPSSGGVWAGVVTTDRSGSAGYYSISYTPNFGGTSSAAPCAAGVAALVLSRNPSLTFAQVYDVLTDTADAIDLVGGNYDGAGHSTKYGYGKVNARAAVDAALGGSCPPDPPDPPTGGGPSVFASADVPKAIPDNSSTGTFSTLTISGQAGTVTDYDVSVSISHTYKGDLEVYLQRPDGQFIKLHDNTGGSANDIHTTYDTQATPSQPLSNLFGASPNGAWRLWAFDLAAQDVGSILGWSLTVWTDAGGGGGGPQTQSWNASDVPIAIPDNDSGGVNSYINVPASGTITDVEVDVNVTHTYEGDLVISLFHPDGQKVILHQKTGGSADDVITTYPTQTTPTWPLSALDGKPAGGLWRLWVKDEANLDLGTLNAWGITITYE